MKKQIVTVIS